MATFGPPGVPKLSSRKDFPIINIAVKMALLFLPAKTMGTKKNFFCCFCFHYTEVVAHVAMKWKRLIIIANQCYSYLLFDSYINLTGKSGNLWWCVKSWFVELTVFQHMAPIQKILNCVCRKLSETFTMDKNNRDCLFPETFSYDLQETTAQALISFQRSAVSGHIYCLNYYVDYIL